MPEHGDLYHIAPSLARYIAFAEQIYCQNSEINPSNWLNPFGVKFAFGRLWKKHIHSVFWGYMLSFLKESVIIIYRSLVRCGLTNSQTMKSAR